MSCQRLISSSTNKGLNDDQDGAQPSHPNGLDSRIFTAQDQANKKLTLSDIFPTYQVIRQLVDLDAFYRFWV